MSANSEACCGLDIGMPDDTMYASPIVSTWTTEGGNVYAAWHKRINKKVQTNNKLQY